MSLAISDDSRPAEDARKQALLERMRRSRAEQVADVLRQLDELPRS